MRSLGGLPEVPCARCGRRVPGLRWGDMCPDCVAQRRRRASRLASRISLAAALLMAAYVVIGFPPTPMARLYGGIAVLAMYIIVRRIATHVAMEYLK